MRIALLFVLALICQAQVKIVGPVSVEGPVIVPLASAASITITGHGSAQSPNVGTPLSITGLTGSTLLICTATNSNGGSETVTDSSSNTWTVAPNQLTSGQTAQTYYVFNPTVTSTMTFWLGASSALFCAGFNNTLLTSGVIDTGTSHSTLANSLTVQAGSISPAGSGELFWSVVGTAQANQHPLTIGSSFTLLDSVTYAGGCCGGASGYFVNSGSGALNPTWTANMNVNWLWSTLSAYKP